MSSLYPHEPFIVDYPVIQFDFLNSSYFYFNALVLYDFFFGRCALFDQKTSENQGYLGRSLDLHLFILICSSTLLYTVPRISMGVSSCSFADASVFNITGWGTNYFYLGEVGIYYWFNSYFYPPFCTAWRILVQCTKERDNGFCSPWGAWPYRIGWRFQSPFSWQARRFLLVCNQLFGSVGTW